MRGCTHSEEPGIWGSRKTEQNRTRGLGQMWQHFPSWRNWVQTCFYPQHNGCCRKSPGLGIRGFRIQLQSCSCGSRSVILSAHPLLNLRLGGLYSMDTFKEKPCCVSKGRHIGELAAAQRTCWERLLDQGHRDAPVPPRQPSNPSCLSRGCLAGAPSVHVHFVFNINEILFLQD